MSLRGKRAKDQDSGVGSSLPSSSQTSARENQVRGRSNSVHYGDRTIYHQTTVYANAVPPYAPAPPAPQFNPSCQDEDAFDYEPQNQALVPSSFYNNNPMSSHKVYAVDVVEERLRKYEAELRRCPEDYVRIINLCRDLIKYVKTHIERAKKIGEDPGFDMDYTLADIAYLQARAYYNKARLSRSSLSKRWESLQKSKVRMEDVELRLQDLLERFPSKRYTMPVRNRLYYVKKHLAKIIKESAYAKDDEAEDLEIELLLPDDGAGMLGKLGLR